MIIKSLSDINKAINFIRNGNYLSYDTETTGLKVRHDQIIGFSFADENTGFYIVHKEWNKDLQQLVEVIPYQTCIEVLELLKDKNLITFNGSFDYRFTKNYFKVNLIPAAWSEVQLARHLSNENLNPFVKLKDIAASILGDEVKKEQADLKASIATNGGTEEEFYKADTDVLGAYAIQDAIITTKVNKHYLQSLKKQNLSRFYFHDETMPQFRDVTVPMEDAGVELDVELVQKTYANISIDIKKLESDIHDKIKPYMASFEKWFLDKEYPVSTSGEFAQEVAKILKPNLPATKTGNYSFASKAMEKLEDCLFKRYLEGKERLPSDIIDQVQKTLQGRAPTFNLSSKHHWKKIFFDELGEQPLSYTDKKQPQVNDAFLESIKSKYDFVALLIDFNKLNKIKGTYLERFLEYRDGSRFYARFQQNTTTTGRYSGDLQQLPRKKEETQQSELVRKYTNVIRDFIVAAPGKVLVDADYASLEVVVFADDSGDEPLLEMIRKDYDLYSTAAIGAWNLHEYSPDKKSPMFLKNHLPEKRQDAKSFALGIRYGMQSYKLHKQLKISEAEAKVIIKNYFAAYPGLKTRMIELAESAKKYGMVKSKTGRIRHLQELRTLWERHGDLMEDSLKLWSKYNDNPAKYREMKELRGKYSNLMNAALNFPIQSMAASIVNRASIAIARTFVAEGLDAKIVMNVHDEICVESSLHCLDRVKEIMQDCMENTTRLSVPLAAEPQHGFRYGDVK